MDEHNEAWPWLCFSEPFWSAGAKDHFGRAVRVFIKESQEFLPEPGSTDDFMDGLQRLRSVREELTTIEMLFVAEARAYGASWTHIGKALGVGRTAAQKRFGGVIAELRPLLASEWERAVASAKDHVRWAKRLNEDSDDARSLLLDDRQLRPVQQQWTAQGH